MAWVRKHGFVPFAIYRVVLGLGVLFWMYRAAHA
jgi:undecaprenyl pyrophosphate phosphatase UppP